MENEIITGISVTIGFILVQLFRDWRDGRYLFKRNENNIVEKMDKLSLHFNHDTTEKLNTIVEKLDEILINGVRIRKE